MFQNVKIFGVTYDFLVLLIGAIHKGTFRSTNKIRYKRENPDSGDSCVVEDFVDFVKPPNMKFDPKHETYTVEVRMNLRVPILHKDRNSHSGEYLCIPPDMMTTFYELIGASKSSHILGSS